MEAAAAFSSCSSAAAYGGGGGGDAGGSRLIHRHFVPFHDPRRISSASSRRRRRLICTSSLSSPPHDYIHSEAAAAAAPPSSRRRQPAVGAALLLLLQSLAAAALDAFESHILSHIERRRPLPPSADPSLQLAGNFSPVPEHPVRHGLPVEGRVPPDLHGVYVRNGANPMYPPIAGHHLFDGDGMLHAVAFSGGGGAPSYANRFTRTCRLREESRLGRPVFPKAIGELHGHTGIARLLLFYARSLFGIVDGRHGLGSANAGLIFFNNLLLAMSEDDLPYAVCITAAHDLLTLGRFDFHGQLSGSMIAHPKLDPVSGELFALSYDVLNKPYLTYFKFSKDGRKGPDVAISGVQQPTMMHDFAITQKYVVIPDQQLVFQLKEMLRGGSPVVHDKQKVARFGVLPKDAVDDEAIRWVLVPDCFCFHLWNAWEDGDDEVVVIGSCMTPPDSIFNDHDHHEDEDDHRPSLRSVLTMIRLNLSTLTSTSQPITLSFNLEAGQINRNFVGRKSQFSYLAITDPWPKVSGIAKVKLQPCSSSSSDSSPSSLAASTCHNRSNTKSIPKSTPNSNPKSTLPTQKSTDPNILATFMYPPNCFGGEPMFVPRSPSSPDSSMLSLDLEEDDGYLLTFMHNEATDKSELLILDAKSPTLNLLASVKLPSRVPYGFHGTFITARELKHQNSQHFPRS